MSRFYGFRYREIEVMPLDIFKDYALSMKRISAIEKLDTLEAVSYPHLKDDTTRSKMRKALLKKAYPERMKKGITFGEFARKQKNGEF